MAQKKSSAASRSSGTKRPTTTARTGSSAKAPSKPKSGSQGTKRPASKSAAASSRPRTKVSTPPPPSPPIRREVGAVVLLFVGLLSVISYFPVDGWLVEGLRKLFMGLFGWGYYLVPVCLLWGAAVLGFHRGYPVALRLTCVLLLPLVFGTFIHVLLFAKDGVFANGGWYGIQRLWQWGQDVTERCGGAVAGTVGIAMKKSVGLLGSFLLLVAAFLMMMLEGFDMSVVDVVTQLRARPVRLYEPQPKPEPDEEAFSPEEMLVQQHLALPVKEKKPAPEKAAKIRRPSFYDQNREQAKDMLFAEFEVDPLAMERVAAAMEAEQAAQREEKKPAPQKTARNGKKEEPKKEAAPQQEPTWPEQTAFEPVKETPPAIAPAPTKAVEPLDLEEAADIAGVEIHSADMDAGAAGPVIVEKVKIDADAEAAAVAQEIAAGETDDKPEYVFPPLELLNKSQAAQDEDGDDTDETEAQLESAIRSFGVGATITGSIHGPTITRYELKLDQGVKLNKITNLANDIALSLGVPSVRIAPIPDKISTVGVEVPNRKIKTIWLGDVVDSDAFRNTKSKLSVALGKDIGGNVITGNIAKMPHLLIAGTTGSGKSVCVNSMILSLLYKTTPDEVRMIMIDPKMVEFVVYNGMPHLYVPVVTDAKKAAGALQWAVVEMLKRYRLFSEAGVRELSAYNTAQRNQGEATLPQVVIFIDELADLMMVASKEVEEAICRVAQMGRAAGMHLVIATQSPRADVITGLMKANIPSRIALSVSSPLESRIILDQQGAEKLLGNGDMLFSPIGSKPIRVQGAFVTDEEREEIIDFVKREAEAEYSDEILAEIEKASVDKNAKDEPDEDAKSKNDYDELLPQAVDVIFETKQASVSMLQRRLKLGYSRAARLIDQLEEVGVVGPYEGSKPRQIVITKQQWQEMQYAQGTAPVDTIAHEFAEVMESDEFAPTDEELAADETAVPAAEEEPQEEEVPW